MKNTLLLLLCQLTGLIGVAQTTNTFPLSGNVGIGTTTPYSIQSYRVLDIKGADAAQGGYIRFSTADESGMARILNSNDRLIFDLQKADMYFQFRGEGNKILHQLTQDGSARWNGNASSYTKIASNQYGQYIQQYDNDGVTLSWIVRGYANNGIQAAFRSGGIEVNGRVRAKEVLVEATNWPDYVFHPDYDLPTLSETAEFIQNHGHLEGMPTAIEVAANGVDLGEMNRRLLEKIEELTLHLIEQDSEKETLQRQVHELIQRVTQLESMNNQ